MPVLNISENEIVTLLGALRTEIKDWDGRIEGSAPRKVDWIKRNIDECLALRARLQACSTSEDESEAPLVVAEITEAEAKRRTAVAKMIIAEIDAAERVDSGKAPTETTPAPRAGSGWHHKHGWLPTAAFMEKPINADVHAAANLIESDLHEIGDVVGAAQSALDDIEERIVSVTGWTTLPDDFGIDDWWHHVTDPEDKIAIAVADTQTDGTEVGFHTSPTEADNAVSKGIWALITRNFSLASDRDMKLAEKALKADPKRLAAIKSSVEGLQKALAQDGKASIYLQVGGECRELHGDADAVEQLLRQLELGTRLQSKYIRRDETGRAYLDQSDVVS